MIIDHDGIKPIYVQIAEWLETEIMNGHFKENEKMFSQYQLAEKLTINPATAAKGLNLLADKQILYKKRGLGMFVSEGAKSFIMAERKEQTLKKLAHEFVLEAYRLSVSEKEMVDMIKEMNEQIKGES
ncbi:GntR family transcriptional regulator [Alkalihalobacillus pseudalcaliphilus]|uniref:GntR family transcriptional regulator n=1 Tax=Alkalihalobacillus pseudalcaliphilus TaxID=79884 RepID=UPI00064DEC73|nr:GntR family transcriptional regulator [Alkalihalobacillus pseudalcaliphilus]KMK75531.1 GntR family transcriptional regulator [Alkalihalobacillus pseudalcaliphilus]